MERIAFDPDQMNRLAAVLRGVAERLEASTARIRAATACCCAPGDVAGVLDDRARTVAARVGIVVEGLANDHRDLMARGEAVRTDQNAVSNAPATAQLVSTQPVVPDPLVAAAIIALQAILVQMIAAHQASSTIGVIGGSASAMSITAGDPAGTSMSSSDLMSQINASGLGTVGGSWSPEQGLGPQYSGPDPLAIAELTMALRGQSGTLTPRSPGIDLTSIAMQPIIGRMYSDTMDGLHDLGQISSVLYQPSSNFSSHADYVTYNDLRRE